MVAQRESMCDLAVGEPFGDAAHHVKFACRQESLSREAGEAQGNRFCDGFEQVVEFTAAGPDLTAVDTEDALGEQLQRLGAEENPAGAGTESLDHCVRSDESNNIMTRVAGELEQMSRHNSNPAVPL